MVGLLLFAQPHFALAAKPQRVISLNLCTDQLLMQLANRETIAGLTPLASDGELSYHANYAVELPQHSGSAEEIIRLNPDLILAGSMSARSTVTVLKRFGYPVVEIDIPTSIIEMQANVRRVARSLGEIARGETMLQTMDTRLAEITRDIAPSWQPLAAVYYANGFSAGDDSVIGEILTLAGYRNVSSLIGHKSFGRLELEALLFAKPDLIIFGNYTEHRYSMAQEILQHPAFRRIVDRKINDYHPVTTIVPDNVWMCATPTIVKAVEILVNNRRKLTRAQ
jgi:iron complex transport system substrate-binding protein